MLYTFKLTVAALLSFIIVIQAGNNEVSYPIFPKQAEFTLESIILDGQHKRTLVECIYDYDRNHLIIISEDTFEFHDYQILKKALYSRTKLQQCNVYPIDVDNAFDGFSAVTDLERNTTHIRPLHDFLLLTLNATFIGVGVARNYIPVNQWMSTLSNESDIVWSFSQANYFMPWSSSSNGYTIPIQRIIKQKSNENILQIWNVFSFKPKITRTNLIPPRGIFCDNLIPTEQISSLQDFDIKFPDRFSIRIDVSTTVQQLWRSVHFRYHLSNEQKLMRFDYTSFDNTQSPMTMILHDSRNISRSYKIDRRTGSCIIGQSIEMNSLTSILHNPIETLMRFVDRLLINTSQRIFQNSGVRPCRGSVLCSIFIGQIPSFPSDSEETWLMTNLEWAWSKRNISDMSTFDYPVYLNLNLYRSFNEQPANVHYEFYDYRTDVHLNEFDVNLCYRSNQLWYQHLAFQLKIKDESTANVLEHSIINRRQLIEAIRAAMVDIMSIKYLRISQLEIDHHPNEPGHSDTLYCVFTLLDRTPFADPNSEIEVLDAKNKLELAINNGQFQFETASGLLVEAIPDSLEDVAYFYAFNPNITINQIDYFFNTTVHVNQTVVEVIEQIQQKTEYADGAQAGAVIGGMFAGLILGVFTILIVVYVIRRKADQSPNGGLTFRNISFRIRNKNAQNEPVTISMEHPLSNRTDA